jgi:DNA-binding MarR family transcriptional regulator
MARALPQYEGQERPANTVVLLREAYLVLNELVLNRLAELGHEAVRSAHAAVFQYLDDTGTTVSLLAERAKMTKQAMAELVGHLERHDYLTRVPDPSDRRAKLVLPTARGREVLAIAQSGVPEMEALIARIIGANRVAELRGDLEAIRRAVG